jgi:capsid protein
VRNGQFPTPGSGDYHAKYDRERMILQSREFMRDNSIYRGMINRAAQYIIGNGFTLQARSGNADFDREAERLWSEYWKRPEIRNTLSGRRVEFMVSRELLTTGDHGAVKTEDGLLQLIESEQIKGPNYSDDGIEKDEYGRPIAFWVSPYAEAGGPDLSRKRRIPAEDFIFIVDPERPSSSRGVPCAQSAFSMLHRVVDVCDSEALAWQLLSRMALSVTRQGASTLAYQESVEDSSKSPAEEGDVTSRLHLFDGGVIFHGEPGEEVKGIERNIPGKDFTESLTTFLRLIGQAIGMPLEVIFLDWTKSNYSQSRAVLEQAFATFQSWQLLIEDFFHRPVYEWFIRRMVAKDELPMVDDFLRHEWVRGSFPWIDQLKEAQAYGEKIDRSFGTLAQVLKMQGLDIDQVLEAREAEVKRAIETSARVKKDTGVDVPWQYFAGNRIPGSSGAAVAETESEESSEAPKSEPEESRDE